MSATIISLKEVLKEQERTVCENDFDHLFTRARILRMHANEETEGGLLLVNMHRLKAWFQREIADEVFRKKLFSRSILSSVWFVSDLLTTFVTVPKDDLSCVTDHLNAYEEDSNPEHLLAGANTAFLLFVFYPEYRPRRPVHYRKFASEIGPSLYANYAHATGHHFGIHMADAFQPLGDIARARFARTV